MMMVELVLNRLWLSFYVGGSVGHGAELLFDMVTMFAVCLLFARWEDLFPFFSFSLDDRQTDPPKGRRGGCFIVVRRVGRIGGYLLTKK